MFQQAIESQRFDGGRELWEEAAGERLNQELDLRSLEEHCPMAEVMEHENIGSCATGDCGGNCVFCCLFVCKKCGLMEGALTTHCPGLHVPHIDQERIYTDGTLDFRDGTWVNLPNPFNQKIGRLRNAS